MWRNFLKEIVYSAPLNGAHLNGAPLINGASLNTARGKRWTYSKRAPHNGCGCDFFLEPAKSYNIAKFCFPAPPFRKKRWCENKNGLILFLKLFLKKRWPKFRHISRHSKQLSEHMWKTKIQETVTCLSSDPWNLLLYWIERRFVKFFNCFSSQTMKRHFCRFCRLRSYLGVCFLAEGYWNAETTPPAQLPGSRYGQVKEWSKGPRKGGSTTVSLLQDGF